MIDSYFSNGNVYVIDDNFNEAKPIIESLSLHQVPHIYMNGSMTSMPSNPKQVRLLFLDLNLKPGTHPLDKKSFQGLHAGILNKLLANNACSYIILIWSKQEDDLYRDFEEIFDIEMFGLENKKPIKTIKLNKQSFFKTVVVDDENDDENHTYDWIDGKEEDLYDLLNKELNENEPFKIFCAWETLISNSGSQTVDYLFELLSGVDEKNINEEMSKIITSLSIAFMGKKNHLSSSNQGKTDSFMLSISELIDDEIDKEIMLKDEPEFTKWCSATKAMNLEPLLRSRLNSKFLISKEQAKKELTGSIFKVDIGRHNFEELLTDSIDPSKESRIMEEYKAKKETDRKIKLDDFCDDFRKDILVSDKIIPIELNLTPLCDVVQKKERYYRMVPGFLLDVDLESYLYKKTDYNHKSPHIFIDHLGKAFIILLDFRLLHSIDKTNLNGLDKLFSLRKGCVDDIQLKLSNHISRLGVLNL